MFIFNYILKKEKLKKMKLKIILIYIANLSILTSSLWLMKFIINKIYPKKIIIKYQIFKLV